MVRQLIELFQVPAEACEVIVYLRRQDRLAVSHYSTILKLGGTARMFPDTGSDHLPRYYDFDRLLQNYAQVVGYEKISVRLYEPAFLVGGDVVRDFYDTVGLGMTPSVTPRVNGSLSLAQAIFLKHFNERFPLVRDGKLNTERGAIFSAIQKVGTGSPFRPDRASAQSFYKHYREGNARVRAQYLPELKRPTLFDEEFSEYPENSSEWTLSESALFDFVEAIWRFKRQH